MSGAVPAWAVRVAEELERRRVPHGPDDYRTSEQLRELAQLIAAVPRCDTCRWWVSRDEQVAVFTDKGFGRCELGDGRSEKVVSIYGDGIQTAPDFGCVQWEANPDGGGGGDKVGGGAMLVRCLSTSGSEAKVRVEELENPDGVWSVYAAGAGPIPCRLVDAVSVGAEITLCGFANMVRPGDILRVKYAPGETMRIEHAPLTPPPAPTP